MEPSTKDSPGFKPSGFQNTFGTQKIPKINTVRVHPYNNNIRGSNFEETNHFNRNFKNNCTKTESKRCFMVEDLNEDYNTRSEIINSFDGVRKYKNERCGQNFTCKQKCMDGTSFENNNKDVSKPVLIGMNSLSKTRNGPLLETPKFPALVKKYISHPVEKGSSHFGGNQFVRQTSPEVRRFPDGNEPSGAALPGDCRKICNSDISEECSEKIHCCTAKKTEVKCCNQKCNSGNFNINNCAFQRATCCCTKTKNIGHLQQVQQICFQNGLLQNQGLILPQNRQQNPGFGNQGYLQRPAYQIQPILTQVVQKCGNYRQNCPVHYPIPCAETKGNKITNSIERESNIINNEEQTQSENLEEVIGCDKSRNCHESVEKCANEKDRAKIDISNQSSDHFESIEDRDKVVDEEMFEVNSEKVLKNCAKISGEKCSCNRHEQVVMPPVGMVLAPGPANNWNIGQPVWNFVPAQNLGRVVGDKVRYYLCYLNLFFYFAQKRV